MKSKVCIHRFVNAAGLRTNAAKTKVLSAEMNPSSCGTITLDGVPLEEVSSFKYLGASVTATEESRWRNHCENQPGTCDIQSIS